MAFCSRNVAWYCKTVELEDDDSTTSIKNVTLIQPIPGECYHCYRKTERRCSDCQRDWFCSDYCQTIREVPHTFTCAIRRPLNSSDYLYLSFPEDVWPDDQQTLEDFGFSKLVSGDDRAKLFGLLKGLSLMDTRSEEVHQGQVEETLQANIIRVFSTLPEESRGGYFP
jgi:hypothetical protein